MGRFHPQLVRFAESLAASGAWDPHHDAMIRPVSRRLVFDCFATGSTDARPDRTQVIHGQGDRLIPFTEAHRLMDGIHNRSRNGLTVTRLFHYKAEHTAERLADRISGRLRLFDALRHLINTTSPAPA